MTADRSYRIGVIGLGLIGGSLALALRQARLTSWIAAYDADPQALDQGIELGVIDEAFAHMDELVARVDVVILATPTRASETLLPRVLSRLADGACVTDVASVKGSLCRIVASLPRAQAARYVPGHPIAGAERHGVEAARPALFRSHRVILSPLESTDGEALALVRRLWEAAGASVVEMPVEDHDAILAATSHLPHMLAYALVDALAADPSQEDIFRFAAGGFRDFTRIASSDPVMWRDIALANRDSLLTAMDRFSAHLADLRQAIVASDGEALEATFAGAKLARDEFLRDLAQRTAAATGPASIAATASAAHPSTTPSTNPSTGPE